MSIILYYYLGYLLGNALIIVSWLLFRVFRRKKNERT